MKSALLRAIGLGCVCALLSFAQQQLTVAKLLEFVKSSISQKLLDKDVAAYLAGVRLTEKLSPRTVEDMQGQGAGPRTMAALAHLAEVSASLPAPVAKAPPPPPRPIPPPPYEEQQKVLEAVRDYALNYSKSLPDFICLEVTRRYYDRHYKPGTEGSWAIEDRIAEKLTYFDQKEKYEPISHNDTSLYGKANAESFGGALSRGDFGTMLKMIFDPASDAEFHWERWGNLDNHLMHVYTYHVDQPHSKLDMDYNHEVQATPGYHGEIFVEKGTNVILRMTVRAEPAPDFPMQDITQVLDYRYVDISGQKFLLPASGQFISRVSAVGSKNEIEFRSYRKYSADTSISFSDVDDPATPDQNNTQAPPK